MNVTWNQPNSAFNYGFSHSLSQLYALRVTNLKKFRLPRAEIGQIDAGKGHPRPGKGLYIGLKCTNARLSWANVRLKRANARPKKAKAGLKIDNAVWERGNNRDKLDHFRYQMSQLRAQIGQIGAQIWVKTVTSLPEKAVLTLSKACSSPFESPNRLF